MMRKPKVKGSGNNRFIGRSMQVDIAQDMRRYDRLPREVRDAIKDIDCDRACVGLAGVLKKGIPPDILARVVRAESAVEHRQFMLAEFGRVPADGDLGDPGSTRRMPCGHPKASET